MTKSKRSVQPVQLFTGKYGLFVLTLLNVGLACLSVTLSKSWGYLNFSNGNEDFVLYFLPDYRIGFISRALIGSILYLFTKHPTARVVGTVLVAVIGLSMLLFSFFQAQIARKTLRQSDYATLLLSYLFFLNTLFWCNSFEYFGLLDIFMTLLLQLYLLGAQTNRTVGIVIAPVVCAVGLLIHTAFLFTGFPVIAAILWFGMLQRGKPDRLCAVFFTVSCILSAALFVYFVFFTREAVRMDENAMVELIRQKYDGEIETDYIRYYLYQVDTERSYTAQSATGFLAHLFRPIRLSSSKIRRLLLFFIPLTGAFLFGCVWHARRSERRGIAYLGFFAPAVCLIPSLNFSTDKGRFFSLIVLAQYMLMHYVVTQTDDRFLPSAADLPKERLSVYASERRVRRIDRTLIVCTVVGLAFTLVGLLLHSSD